MRHFLSLITHAFAKYDTVFFNREDGYEEDEEEEVDKWKHCALAPAKDDVAAIFARSTRGEKEFPEFSVNQRAAVALARYLQDPLVEFAGMPCMYINI